MAHNRYREMAGDDRRVRRLGLDPAAGPYLLERPGPVAATARVLAGFAIAMFALYLWPARYGGSTSMIIVRGHSMEPTMHTGDIVVVRGVGHYAPGQIVVFRVPDNEPGAGAMIVHRLVAHQLNGTSVFKGDNNRGPDSFHPRDVDIVGRRVFLVPVLGQALLRATNPLWMAIAVGVFTAIWWRFSDRRRSYAVLPRPYCLSTRAAGMSRHCRV